MAIAPPAADVDPAQRSEALRAAWAILSPHGGPVSPGDLIEMADYIATGTILDHDEREESA